MWFKHRGWIPAAWILSGINVLAAWVAARAGEPIHAWVHVALTVALAAGARHLMARRRPALADDLQEVLDENERLQEEVEILQPRVEELEERVAFAERLLAQQRDQVHREPPPR
ncbi:MAG: hypothetical protein KJZ47_03900 [Gemmatimonadales bacterium]|nr:hypothetical protein [Gemmatimonadales bacterium]